eukprot:5954498-Pyramimonas_sp.AAC.1
MLADPKNECGRMLTCALQGHPYDCQHTTANTIPRNGIIRRYSSPRGGGARALAVVGGHKGDGREAVPTQARRFVIPVVCYLIGCARASFTFYQGRHQGCHHGCQSPG